ncbi:MAG: hypothetical protein GY725_21280 [bacterium]|nr:hypothetical protein [bacterium]
MKWSILICLVALIACTDARAEESADQKPATASVSETPPVAAFPTPMAVPLARICLAIALISGTGFGLAWWTRNKRGQIRGTDARIEVVASRNISPRHQVVLIDVAGQRLLIGTGGESIRTLADLSESHAFSEALNRQLPTGDRADLVDSIGRFEGLDA